MNSLFKYKKAGVPVLLLFAFLTFGWGQGEPRLGYIYPAGAQLGTTVELTMGGRGLGGVETVLCNKGGVSAEVLEHVSNAKRKYAAYLRRIGAIYKKAPVGLDAEGFGRLQAQARQIEEIKLGNAVAKVPQLESFRRLTALPLPAFREAAEKFRLMENVQTNAEISELLRVRITVADNAPVGPCEIRLSGRRGLSNPVRFELGSLPEFAESEPNDKGEGAVLDAARPFLVNGQVMPGDVDRIRFSAKGGQTLVMQLRARELIPFLADAVPGWFQAILRVVDGAGREVAFADDFEFRPDPVLCFAVPEDGVYTVEIRDSIFRGREDFVYRLELGETPFVTSMFPLGAKLGEERVARLEGWNLESATVQMKTAGVRPRLVAGRLKSTAGVSNRFLYRVGESPVRVEGESLQSGDLIALGETLAGSISERGERDVFRFFGEAGQSVKLEVRARRLSSPLDARLALFSPDGALLFEADNLPPENHGLDTDHADSLLEVELPAAGVYTVRLDDVQGRGGQGFGYLLETGKARPDFELVVYPSGLRLAPGGSRPVAVRAFRRSGFAGPIRLSLGRNSKGFRLSGAVIPEGQDSVEVVVSAVREAGLYELELFGYAEIGGSRVQHRATPCEPAVQAFITHHLVDASSFLVEVGGRPIALPRLDLDGGALELLPAGKTELRLEKRKGASRGVAHFEFELSGSSMGVTIEGVREEKDAYVLSLSGASELEGTEGWLVLQCYALMQKTGSPEKARKPRRVYVGSLPAIPYRCEGCKDV